MARKQLLLTMTREEWVFLREYSPPGKRSAFIRQAIKRLIEAIKELQEEAETATKETK